jgi:very-short-patch-repair endonuclease
MADDEQRERARELREEMTDAEQTLWQHLRARRLCDTKFRRQEPLGDYIVDFVSFEVDLVVEVDGRQHHEQQGYDETRTKWLEEQGFSVVRFWNNQVLTETKNVLREIRQRIIDLREE